MWRKQSLKWHLIFFRIETIVLEVWSLREFLWIIPVLWIFDISTVSVHGIVFKTDLFSSYASLTWKIFLQFIRWYVLVFKMKSCLPLRNTISISQFKKKYWVLRFRKFWRFLCTTIEKYCSLNWLEHAAIATCEAYLTIFLPQTILVPISTKTKEWFTGITVRGYFHCCFVYHVNHYELSLWPKLHEY